MTFFEWFYKAVIVQMVCALIILLAVVVMKYFFSAPYEEFRAFYIDNMNCDTNVSEVLDNEV